MTLLIFSLVLLMTAIVAWFLVQWLVAAFQQYQHLFQEQTTHSLSEFFLFLDPLQLWVANLVLCTFFFGLAYVLLATIWAGIVAASIALCVPRVVLVRLRARRQIRFEEQLPDLLLSLASALRAGSAVQSALRHIVMQSPAPLGQEFALMLREQRMGVSFDQALRQLYLRMPGEGMGLLVSALGIALHSGGNLAETLERIAATLRARQQLLGRIEALTSQGRMQARVMAALPVLLALVLAWLEPDTMELLWHTWPGKSVIGLILILEVAGFLLIRRIVTIRV